jgi:hypothetical protein
MKLQPIKFATLTAKQKEIYNFQKISGLLADYGFNCIKLADDWRGADFLAYHKDGNKTLKVQLKSRLTIEGKYEGKGLYMTFPIKGTWYLAPHDELVAHVEATTNWLESPSWKKRGWYSTAAPSAALRKRLSPNAIEGLLGVVN